MFSRILEFFFSTDPNGMFLFNPLQPGVAYLYPLKTSQKQGFPMFSGGTDKRSWAVMGQ